MFLVCTKHTSHTFSTLKSNGCNPTNLFAPLPTPFPKPLHTSSISCLHKVRVTFSQKRHKVEMEVCSSISILESWGGVGRSDGVWVRDNAIHLSNYTLGLFSSLSLSLSVVLFNSFYAYVCVCVLLRIWKLFCLYESGWEICFRPLWRIPTIPWCFW